MLDLHTLPLEQLYFDPNNYRLRKEMNFEFFGEGELCKPEVQQKTKLDIGGEKIKNPLFGEEKIPKNITDLMTSFKSIGYLKINPLIVRKIEGESDKYLVVDGNRRLAALKELRNSWAHGGNIGALNPEIFNNIPINLLEENEDVDTIVGINHLAGSKSWSAINQARFLEHLVIARGDSNKISDELGLNKSFFQNSIRVLIIINKYKESDYAFQWEDNKYSLFQEIMISKSIKYWLDWNTETNEIKNTSNLEKLFSLISKEEAFDENGKEISYEPVLARTKDIRDFSRLVENDAATSYLIENRDLYKTLRKFGIADEPENLPTTIDTINRSLDVLFGSVDALTKDDRLAILKIIDNLNRFKTEKLNSLSDALPSIEQRKNNMVNILPKKGEFPIESFKISKYKKFQDFELNNLSRINIFAGKNNSGKSSLLEAIYINTFLTDIRGIMDVTQKRARLSNLYTDKKWILDNVTTDFLVSIKNKNQDYSVQANIGDNISPEKNISGFFKTIVLKAICAEEKIDSFNYLYFNKDNIINGQLKYICPSIYTSPFTFSKSELVEECYALTFSNKRIFENETIFEKVVNFIKKNVDSNITDIRLIEGPLTFWVIYNNQDTKDLAQSGDGLQRLFYLALLFANCENGVVCIDEFESAIYFGLLEKFTKLVQELAVEFNVQVFLTTHSKECVDAFILNDFRTEDISAYTLLPKKDGTVTAFYYSGDKLKRLIEKLDTDVRTL